MRMTATETITLFHAPNSRSTGTLILLEELGAPYDLHVLNLQTGDNRQPGFLAVNPLGKVPAILHGDSLVTEQVAIYIYLADLFPQAGLAPGLNDKRRGPYLRWMAFYGACFEPALVQVNEARARSAGDVAVRQLRGGAVDVDRTIGSRTVYARSGVFGRGRAVGHRVAMDDGVRIGARNPGHQGVS
jgi:glutathione S-transferase